MSNDDAQGGVRVICEDVDPPPATRALARMIETHLEDRAFAETAQGFTGSCTIKRADGSQPVTLSFGETP